VAIPRPVGGEEAVDTATTLASDPQAMSWGQGRVDLFAKVGTTLQHRTWTNSILPLFGQETDYWCWVATAQMIGSHFGCGRHPVWRGDDL
jgi:hypothetical protein